MKNKLWIACIALAGLLISCAVKQDIWLKLDGSGNAALKIELEEVFMNYLFDMAEATTDIDSPQELVIFNIPEIKAALEDQPGVTVGKILSSDLNSLEIELQYRSISEFATALGGSGGNPLFLFKKSGDIREFYFYLDKMNYKEIKKLFPLLENPLFENLEPQVEEKVTREEYLDIIEFAMEEEGREAVNRAFVQVNLSVAGEIISQQGGQLKNGIIQVLIPLLDLLLLNKPVEFSLRYK